MNFDHYMLLLVHLIEMKFEYYFFYLEFDLDQLNYLLDSLLNYLQKKIVLKACFN
jgi:hypothetical protein